MRSFFQNILHILRSRLTFAVSAFLLLHYTSLFPQTSISTGNWNDPLIWSPAIVPGAGSTVIIGAGTVVTLSAAAQCLDLTINNGVLNIENQTFRVTGNFTFNGGNLNLTTGTIYFRDVDFTYTAGSYSWGTGTVIFNRGGNQLITGLADYYNLIFTGGGQKTLKDDVTVNGDFTIQNGPIYNGNNHTLSLKGDWINNNLTDGFNEALSPVIFNGTAPQSISSVNGETFETLTLSNSSGIILGCNITANIINISDNCCVDFAGFTMTSTVLNQASPPIALCKDPTVYLNGLGQVTISVTDIDNGSTVDCGVPDLSIDLNTFDCTDLGDHSVTLTVEDIYGVQATCTSTVTIADTTDPTITCPSEVNETNSHDGAGDCTTTATLGVPASGDNCTAVSVIAQISGVTIDPASYLFPIGETTVTWIATDGSGNTTSCTQKVTITDEEDPVINTCVPDKDVVLDASCNYTLPDYTNDAAISVTECSTYDITQSPLPGTGISDTTTITLTVIDEYGNLSTCNFRVLVNDTIKPTFTVPENDTICRDLLCNYDSDPEITGDVKDETDNCCIGLNAIYTDNLDNLHNCDTAGYIIRSWSVTDKYKNTTIKNQIIWVEPVSRITVSPKFDSICNGDAVNIRLHSPTIPTRPVRFRYVTETPAGVTVSPANGNPLPNDYTLTNTIINTTDIAQLVKFIITPYTRNASNDGEKCTGINDTAYVWVEPTAKLAVTPKVDTICNGSQVNILLHSPTVPTRPVRFRYVTEAPAGVTVTPATGNPLSNDYTLTNTIVNTTDNAQLVKFIITPYTRNASDDGEKCTGINDTAYVWVEPTAKLGVTPKVDTICNGSQVNILLHSPTIPTRQVRFRYVTETPAGVTVTPASGTNLPNDQVLTNTILNTTDNAQLVKFIITPYTRNASDDGEKCTGINDTAYVWVEPIAKLGVTPKTDTICNGDAVSIDLHSPTVPTRPVRFRYVTEAPAGVTVTPASGNNLQNDYRLHNTIINTTDNAQLVKFIIAPYTRNSRNDGEKCTGINDTAFVWVEPTATLILNPQIDTICSAENVNINLGSNTVPTMPVLFRYYTVHNAGVNVVPGNGTSMSNPNAVTDYIENTTNQAQRVLYIITPYNTDDKGIEKCPGITDTSIVWVEPVPKVDLTPFLDTICTNLKTDILTHSVTNSLQEVKLLYKTFKSPQIEINRSQDTIDLEPGERLDDVLINHSDIPQRVMFVVYPYLSGYNGSQKCPGIPDTVYVWVAPELKIIVDTISTYIGGNNIRCFGFKDGSIQLVPKGGISAFPGYDDSDLGYAWQGAGKQWITRDIYGLGAANYSIVITDKLTCRDDSVITLTQPALLTNYYKEINKLKSCKAGDGIIGMNTHGGIQKYTYNWELLPADYKKKMSAEKDTLFDIIAGIYRVKVTDVNGCFTLRDTLISQPTNTKVTPMSYHTYGFGPDDKQYTIKCNGEYGMLYTVNEDTSLTITYHWICDETGFDTTYTHNRLTDTIEYIRAGIYHLTYLDENGCSGYGDVEMIEPETLRIDRATVQQYTGGFNVSCYGQNDGSIILNEVNGGHIEQPYQYAWESTSGGTIQNPSSRNQVNLAAGSYKVTIMDFYGCTGADTFDLTSPQKIVISDEVSLSNAGNYNLNCSGDRTGFIKLTVTGGVPAYNYKWLDNSTTASERFNLKAGDYEVTVIDALNCKLKDTISLTEPDKLIIDSAGISDFNGYAVRCSGNSDAAIGIRIAGGTPDYTYVWTYNGNPLPDNAALLINKPAGQYHLNITDANNCTLAWSALLDEPGLLQLEVEKTNMNCTGLVAGTAEAHASGGNGPYSYNWSNGSTTAKITGLNPGDYIIEVSDNNSCLISDTVTVLQNTEVGISINIEKPVSCYQSSDAVLKAIATDGVPPYLYNWLNGGPQTDVNQNLAAGTYTVEVIDNDGCEGTATFELVQPDKLKAGFIVTDPSCFGGDDGSADLSAAGGNYPYTYYWDGNPVTGETVNDLQKGTYTLTVKDHQECQADTTVNVSEPDKLHISLDESATIYPFCPDWQNGVLSVSVSGGTRDYSYEWDYSDQEHDSIISALKEDTYSVHVVDAMNCKTDTTFRLRALHNNCLQLPTAFTPNYDNANDFWEIRYMTEDGSEVKFNQVYPEGKIKIYDRMGNLVYECTGGCPQDWNGEDTHGRQLPVDTYYYIIDLNTADDNPPLKGIVTIIR